MVGLAAISAKNKVHRDISEGNILSAPLRVPGADSEGDVDCWSEGEGESTVVDSDEVEDTTQNDVDVDSVFNSQPLEPEAGKIE